MFENAKTISLCLPCFPINLKKNKGYGRKLSENI